MKKNIKLIALDLDGTLLDNQKRLSHKNRETIKNAIKNGILVIISTGRPFSGLPIEDINDMGIQYAISTNGSAIYQFPEGEMIFADGIESESAYEIMQKLSEYDIHIDATMNGQCYGHRPAYDKVKDLSIEESMKGYIQRSRVFVDDLKEHVRNAQALVQKMTIYFYSFEGEEYRNYDETAACLAKIDGIDVVCGGNHNFEVTKKGISKGQALCYLAGKLGVDISETMACGDTENDIDILKTAGVGVAMSNATDDVKEIADFISLSNEEDGVAYAIQYYLGDLE